jgi:hypothetical protein
MKNLVALFASFACVAGAFAQYAPGEKTAPADKSADSTKASPDTKTPPSKMRIVLPPDKPASGKTAPAGPTAPGGKAADKGKKEEPAKIEGVEIARGEGKGYLGVQIVNSTFKINFYDAKKKPVAPDVARAALRWDPKYKVGEERVILNPSEKSLASPKNIRPPYNFKLFITLFKEPAEGADPVVSENYVIDFRQ